MAHEFEEGQKIRPIANGVRSAYGHYFKRDDVVTVARVGLGERRRGYPLHTLGVSRGDEGTASWTWIVNPADFEPIGPKWSDVEAGDKVTFRTRGAVAVKETRLAYGTAETPTVLGISTKSLIINEAWELLSIEKPKPQPPTTPGSHVVLKRPEYGPEYGPNHLFLMERGRWASQTGRAYWNALDVAEAGFEVIHDAGKGV